MRNSGKFNLDSYLSESTNSVTLYLEMGSTDQQSELKNKTKKSFPIFIFLKPDHTFS